MKTKRIVALALAGVLAAGAVTPVFAEEANYGFEKLTTTEAYGKVHDAQLATVKSLEKKVGDLTAAETEANQANLGAIEAVGTAKLEVQKAEHAYELKEKEIAGLQDDLKGVLDQKNENEKEYHHLGYGEPLTTEVEYTNWINEEKQLADQTLSDSGFEARLGDLIAKAQKENEAWETKALTSYVKGTKKFPYEEADSKKFTELKAQFDALKKEYVDANADLNKAKDAQKWWKKNLKELNTDASTMQNEIYEAQSKRDHELKNNIEEAKMYYNDAVAAQKAAEKNWVTIVAQLDAAKKSYDAEKSNLDRIQKILSKITLDTIKNETDPELVKLASKDTLAYYLGKLVEDDVFLSKETLDELGLTETTLKLYQDLLGDQGELEEPTSQAPNTEEPTSQAPNTEEPTSQAPNTEVQDPQKPAASDKTEGKTPNADKKGDKNDKNDKKANKDKKAAPKTGDISVLAYAGSAVLAAGAFVASKKRK